MASKILLKIFLAVLLLKLCNGKGSSGSHQVTTTITSQGTDPVKPTSSSCSAENSFEMIIEASSVEDLKKVLEDSAELNAFIGKHMEDLAENTGDGTCGDDIAIPTTGITPDSEILQTTTQRSGTDNTADQVTKFETSTSSDSLQTTTQQAEIETTEESVTTFKTTELQMSATPMPSEDMMNESFYAEGFEDWTTTEVITTKQLTLSCKNDTLLNIHQACYCGSCCSGYCGCPEITKVMSKICNLNQSCNMNVSDIVNTLEQYADCQINVSYTCIKKDSLAGKILNKTDWYQASNKYWYQCDKNDKKNFSDANKTCNSSGRRLASMGIRNNNTKWQLVHKYEWKQIFGPRIRWVGLEKIKTDCWKWNDGTFMKDELWNDGEPNNGAKRKAITQNCDGIGMESGTEDCGFPDANHNWKMSDGICSVLSPFVCETACNVSYQGRCFRIEKSKPSSTLWNATSSYGEQWKLATVYDQTHLNLLRDQISSNSTESISLWLGMTVIQKEVTNKTICLQPEMLSINVVAGMVVYINSTNRCLNVSKKSDKLDGSIWEYIGPPPIKG